MAHPVARDRSDTPQSNAFETLYWWRRTAPHPQGLPGQPSALHPFAALVDGEALPGNRLREVAARRRQIEIAAAALRPDAAEAEAAARLTARRREAIFAAATGVVASLAAAAAAACSIADHQPIALGFALAGLCAAAAAMAQALRSLLALRSAAPQRVPRDC